MSLLPGTAGWSTLLESPLCWYFLWVPAWCVKKNKAILRRPMPQMKQTAGKEVSESEKVEERCFDRETEPKSSSHVIPLGPPPCPPPWIYF